VHGGEVAVAALALPHERVTFAHRIEHQLARLLDGHGIPWEYEPHTFVLRCDEDGTAASEFTPDFWLPEHGRYLDVTPLDQRLVARKLCALHRLREVHPEIDVTLVHQRDYRALLLSPVRGLCREPSQDGSRAPLPSAG
jgi:hypothetical protein